MTGPYELSVQETSVVIFLILKFALINFNTRIDLIITQRYQKKENNGNNN